MRPRTLLTVLLTVSALVAIACQPALGYWSGADSAGSGQGVAGATTVDQGATPTASQTSATAVLLSWATTGLASGGPQADGYVVRRYDAGTGAESAIAAGCSGTITAATCTDLGVPAGTWQYSVTPLFGDNWRGAESQKSGAVSTGPASLFLSRTLFGGIVAPLPTDVTGNVTGLGADQAITFFLDGTVELVGSPGNVNGGGGASISLTLPAGISDGPHTVSVRSAIAEASAGILIDNTPPTVTIDTTPKPNTYGWNNSEPVEVTATGNDGGGSGVAETRYTDDGSDPRTSPTARLAEGPVMVAVTTTLRFFSTDQAGNTSAVATAEIRIDTVPPRFTIDFTEVEGGAYIAPANELTGELGEAFYRGAGAGSLRFLMTPVPLGGSAPLLANFEELSGGATGFSFISSSETTPAGGPFGSNLVTWVGGAGGTPAERLTLANEAGSSSSSTLLLHDDSTTPTGGSVDATGLTGPDGRRSTKLTLSLKLEKGTDSGSGLADGSGPSDVAAILQRASAPLTSVDGISSTCGIFSSFVQVGEENPSSPFSDTVPTDLRCYIYRYLVSDHVGNVATYSSPEIKVDTGPQPVVLGEAARFAVLGASTVTSDGVSVLNGDLGVSPGTAMTGFPPGEVNGTMHSADPAANQGQADVGTAFADAAGRSPAAPIAGTLDGETFGRGVYTSASYSLTGDLTLDAEGDPDAVFIFQAGSTLTTIALSRVKLINGAQACNVFWQVGSSATIGGSTFSGNILAFASISMTADVEMDGRAFAHNGAVTLISDTISVPSCETAA